MKLKNLSNRFYGLRSQFALKLLISTLICLMVFFALYAATDIVLDEYFENSDFEAAHIERQGESLQKYIDKNEISSENLELLKKWERRQTVILMEMYAGDNCIYSSFHDVSDASAGIIEDFDENNNLVNIKLRDMEVRTVLYSDFTYQYYLIGTCLAVVLALVIFVAIFLRSNRKLIRYICRLNEEIQILEGGNLEYTVSVEGNDEITDLARSMNRMKESFREQIETEQRLYKANRRLVTEMSHDLRTPLTGIMLYTEILRSKRYSDEEEMRNYFDKINTKANQLKMISDHLFEYSMDENSGGHIEYMSLERMFSHDLKMFCDDLEARGFKVRIESPDTVCQVRADREYIHRIFGNLVSNIEKYAEPSVEIVVDFVDMEQYCGFSIMNVHSSEYSNPESNGIGIESIRSMMKNMEGICTVENTDSVFEIVLMFLKHESMEE